MNITTKLIIPGVALLYSISVANAAQLPQDIPENVVTAIAKNYEYDENFVRNSYEKFMALHQGNLQELDRLFSNVAEVNELIFDFRIPKTEFGAADLNTPLAIACYLNNVELVEWLLDHGADANQIVSDKEGINVGRKLLEIVCLKGNIDTAKLFLKYGAELTEDEIADLKETTAYRLTMHAELYNKEMQKREVNAVRRKFLANEIEVCLRTYSLLDECSEGE